MRRNGPSRTSCLVGAILLAIALFCGACSGGGRPTLGRTVVANIHKIRHVVVIMQENRSFAAPAFATSPPMSVLLRVVSSIANEMAEKSNSPPARESPASCG
jgi:hypothetical protein